MKPRQPISVDTARERLETLCSRGEYCRYELSEKLRRWLVPQSDAEKILEALHSRKFFDDARYAAIYARQKASYSRWGRRKIVMGLRAKRVDSDIISTALEVIDSAEYQRNLVALLRAKARTLPEGNTYEGRTKLFRFGISRGYESELVSQAIRAGHLFDAETDE